ncbi:MAG: hypothetical protein EAZ11_08780 [Curvibacter sp.]|nr:MAG: hypothetical protein EAZ11_08780 [Curvibacter sp.]
MGRFKPNWRLGHVRYATVATKTIALHAPLFWIDEIGNDAPEGKPQAVGACYDAPKKPIGIFLYFKIQNITKRFKHEQSI